MEEIGIVTGVDGVHAIVTVEKKSACDHCTAGTCKVSGEKATIEAINEAQAKVGQRVRVRLRALAYFKGSLLFYGLPTVSLIAGAVIGREYFAGWFEGMDPEGVSALSAFIFLGLSLVAVRLIGSKAEKSVKYQPIVEEILDD